MQEDESDEENNINNNATQDFIEIEEGNIAGTDHAAFDGNDIDVDHDNLACAEKALLDDGNDFMGNYNDDLTGDDISELSISSPVLR